MGWDGGGQVLRSAAAGTWSAYRARKSATTGATAAHDVQPHVGIIAASSRPLCTGPIWVAFTRGVPLAAASRARSPRSAVEKAVPR